MTLWQQVRTASNPLAAGFAMIALIATATTLAALFFRHVLGLLPCHLCLEQRHPYYVVIPSAGALSVLSLTKFPRPLLMTSALAITAVMAYSGWLGLNHAGVEWKWWSGPAECSGAVGSFGSAENLLERLRTDHVVRCDDAPWRLLGLSLAGYNFLISLTLALIAAGSVIADLRPSTNSRRSR